MRTLTRKEIVRRLDTLRQTCARYEGAKKKGGKWYNTCVTCGREVLCSKANGGHFLGRACMPYRWDERNVHCQDVYCNLHRNGAYIEYSQWFIKTYGQDIFDRYVNDYKKWQQGKLPAFKIGELRDLYDEWLKKGRALEQRTGLSLFPKSWQPFGPDFIATPLVGKR